MSTESKYCCETCGHPILPRDPLAMLGPTQRTIFDTIYAAGQAGIDGDAVRERVYRGDGGASRSLLTVHINHINKKVALLGLRIASQRLGPHGSRYTVIRTRIAEHESMTAHKLSAKAVLKIREDTRSNRKIAASHAISPRSVDRIKKRQTWTHV